MPRDKKENTIDNLLGNFKTPAIGSLFEVNFYGPEGLNLKGVRARSVSIPSRSIEVTPVSEFGKERQMPTGKVDDGGATFAVSFICDNDFEDRIILQAWHDYIYGGDTNADTESPTHTLPLFKFYDEYKGRIELYHLRRDATETMKIEMEEAFPISFDAVSLSADVNDPITITVNFAYRYFKTTYVPHEPTEREAHPVYGQDRRMPNGLNNRGRNQLNGVLEALSVASRFNKKSSKILNRLSSLDTAISQAKNVKRNFTNFRGRFGG
jgi:hypothetical protein